MKVRNASSAWVLSMVLGTCVAMGGGAPGPEDASYRAGIGLLNKGMHDLAAPELEKFLKEHPDADEARNARYALAVCYSRSGKHARAAAELDRVIPVPGFAFQADAMLLRAYCSVALGDDAGAVNVLARLLQEHGDWEQAGRAAGLQGEVLYRLGRYPEARNVLQRAAETVKTGEDRDRIELYGALTERAMGDSLKAAERLKKLREGSAAPEIKQSALLAEAQCRHAAGELEASLDLYRRACESTQGALNAQANLGRGQVARALGKLDEAKEALTGVPDGKAGGSVAAAASLELGRVELDAGRIDRAAEIFGTVAAGGDAELADDAAYWAAKCVLRKGDNAAAAELFSKVASQFPRSELQGEMLFDAASALTRAGQDEDAAAAWGRWLERYPSHTLAPEAVAAHAGCLHRLRRWEESLAACERFTAAYATHPRVAGVRLLIAENHFAAGDFARAEREFEALGKGATDDGMKWRASVRRGMCLLAMGRGDEGFSMLSSDLEDHGDAEPSLRAAALSALGEYCMEHEKWGQGERCFDELARGSAGHAGEADALLRRGVCLTMLGKEADAIGVFDRAIAADPAGSAGLHAAFEKGQALVKAGRLDEARKSMELVIAKEAGGEDRTLTPHAQRHLAGIARAQGDPGRAAELLGAMAQGGDRQAALDQAGALMAAGEYAKAEAAYTAFIAKGKQDPRLGEALVMRAAAINRQDRRDEALREMDGLKGVSLDDTMRATLMYERAMALRAMGRDDDAQQAYRDLLQTPAPKRLEAYAAMDLAQMLADKAKHAEAMGLLDRCEGAGASLSKDDAERVAPRLRYLRAVCLLGADRAAEAVQAIDKGGPLPRGELESAVSLVKGEALLKCGRAAEAIEALRPACEGKSDAARAAAGTLRMGEAYAVLQQWQRSDETYTQFLDEFPQSELWFQARFGQGWARENQGRHDAAIEAYQDVVQRHQGQTAARAQFQIGECLYAQKQHERAVAELLKVDVLYSYPQWSAAALYEAGRCLVEMKRPQEAAKQFDDVIERFPESTWAGLARERREAIRPEAIPGAPTPVKGQK